MTPETKIKIAAKALTDKKAIDLSCVEVGELTALTEYFLFCTATSSTHVHALADEAEHKLREAGEPPRHIEGKATDWILLDYGDVILHIFGRQSREFYGLDKMWSDGTPVDLTPYINSEETEA